MTDSNSNYSDLPLGWKWIVISNVANVDLGKTPKKSQYINEGKFKIIKFRDVDYSGIDWFNSKAGFVTENSIAELKELIPYDVLITSSAHSSEHIGKKIAFVKKIPQEYERVFFVGELLNIRSQPDILNPQFVFFYFLSRDGYTAIQSKVKGVHLTSGEARKLEIPLPPLPEQHRIVEKIEELFSELDNGVASLKKALEQLKTYRQAVLKWAFEGKLTEKWRNTHQDSLEDADTLLEQIKAERKRHYQQQLEDWKQALKEWENNGKETKKPTKPQQPKDLPPLTKEELSNLPSLPNGWMWVKVDYLLSLDKKGMTTGPFGTLLKKSEHQISGIPVLGIENIGNGVFLPKNKIFITEKKARELSSFEVSGGDIIISRSGTVGEICLVPDYFGYSLISTNLIRISLNKTIISPKFFVFLFLGGGSVREQVKELCKGSTRDFLNQTILQSIIFPFPSLQEQTQIVQEIESRLSVCDQLEATLTENLDKAEALRQSILKRAFEGKLVL
ncbi:restriction endonuclease subunit S [Microcystis sp. CS-574]|uniref:restriction endonuclease subunit S n=1 Tax=Microcystis sp. CS-574 TaxID=3021718 RepID=UPI00232BC8E0|nr:restriction endonuclease subunit S [Microcystis sp. CS-574]MDB9405165.1 restriction endonuclease subunit S [Microcystis sp. CS-574]